MKQNLFDNKHNNKKIRQDSLQAAGESLHQLITSC
jgi:hypothetical protein